MYISVLMFVTTVVPLFVISHYNFMSVDDYPNVLGSISVWRSEHSVLRVFEDHFSDALSWYYTWQGTFAPIWIMGSILTIIGENYYFLTTYITLGGMILSELILFMLIGLKGLKANFTDVGIISCWIIIVQVLMVPYPVEAFFWACGAFFYVTVFNSAVLLYALVFEFIRHFKNEADNNEISEKNNNRGDKTKLVIIQTGILILSAYIGMGNFVSAIFCFSSYICFVIFALIAKVRGRIIILFDSIIYTVFFLLNVMAPGNASRQAASGVERMSAIKAVIKSIYTAANYIICNLYPTVLIVMIMMVPFIIGLVKKKAFDERRTFKYPIVFSIFSFGLYASQFVPTMYSLGILGAGRIVNLYRLTLYLFLFANLIYWTGWLLNRLHVDHPEISSELFVPRKSYLLLFEIACFAVFSFSAIFYGGTTLTSVSAFNSLRTGQARIYQEEQNNRLVILHDDTIKDVYVEKFSNPPYVLYFGDVQENSDAWENMDMASFYGKNSISREP